MPRPKKKEKRKRRELRARDNYFGFEAAKFNLCELTLKPLIGNKNSNKSRHFFHPAAPENAGKKLLNPPTKLGSEIQKFSARSKSNNPQVYIHTSKRKWSDGPLQSTQKITTSLTIVQVDSVFERISNVLYSTHNSKYRYNQ